MSHTPVQHPLTVKCFPEGIRRLNSLLRRRAVPPRVAFGGFLFRSRCNLEANVFRGPRRLALDPSNSSVVGNMCAMLLLSLLLLSLLFIVDQ